MKKLSIISLICFVTLFCFMLMCKADTKKTDIKIAFLGDSITEYGWEYPDGYVKKAVEKLNEAGYNVTPIPAGVCGDVTLQMLKRMDADVLSKNPDVIFFMGGINDVWHRRSTTAKYRREIEKIVTKAKEKNVKLILLNLTVISEDLNSQKNKKIVKFNEVLEEIAKENNLQLIDVHSAFENEIKNYQKDSETLTFDGVHLTDKGNTVLADKLVKDFLEKNKN